VHHSAKRVMRYNFQLWNAFAPARQILHISPRIGYDGEVHAAAHEALKVTMVTCQMSGSPDSASQFGCNAHRHVGSSKAALCER
jgi:hypothetical protein